MKECKIYLIANSHVDPIWQWDEDEGIFSALSTFRSAVNLLDEFDFIFCHNEAYLYEKIEQLDKDLFERIKKAIADGKWVIMGGWYLQPDCLMPKGESIVRQILVGKNYFLEKFGVEPKTAINFDPFGHSRGIVQIVKKCNQNGYIATRPSKDLFDYPDECFEWVGYDGSIIKYYYCSSYSTPLGYAGYLINKEIEDRKSSDNKTFIKLWGVGNHGGGPSRKDLADIEQIKNSTNVELLHSTPDEALSQIPAKGTVSSSLNNQNVGCYTSMGKLKRKYLSVESLYYQVEKMASVASLSGFAYPKEDLDFALKNILLCEFHDLLPGTCIKSGEDFALSVLGSAEKTLKDVRLSLTNYLCGGDAVAKEQEYPIYVFNDLPYKVRKYVESELCVIPICGADEETVIHIKDAYGCEQISQITKEDSNVSMDWRKRIGFYADLEPLSFTRFDVFVTYKKIVPIKEKKVIDDDFIVKTKVGHVSISGKTGAINEYVVNGQKYLNSDSFVLFAYEDNEDPWGHKKKKDDPLGKNPKKFRLGGKGLFEGQNAIKVVEDGEIFTLVESLYYYKQMQAVIQYKIYKEYSRIDVKIGVVLSNKNILVKAHVPIINKQVIGGQMFGEEEIDCIGKENIVQEFIKIPFDRNSLNIALLDSYGVSYNGKDLKLSLVRGTTYCAHPIGDRPILETNRYIPSMDLGLSEINFTMFVDNKDCVAGVTRKLNRPYAIQLFPSGSGKPMSPKIELNDERILLETLKRSESGNGYIVRLFNSSENEVKCELVFANKKALLSFNKYEVKTIKISESIVESYELKI